MLLREGLHAHVVDGRSLSLPSGVFYVDGKNPRDSWFEWRYFHDTLGMNRKVWKWWGEQRSRGLFAKLVSLWGLSAKAFCDAPSLQSHNRHEFVQEFLVKGEALVPLLLSLAARVQLSTVARASAARMAMRLLDLVQEGLTGLPRGSVQLEVDEQVLDFTSRGIVGLRASDSSLATEFEHCVWQQDRPKSFEDMGFRHFVHFMANVGEHGGFQAKAMAQEVLEKLVDIMGFGLSRRLSQVSSAQTVPDQLVGPAGSRRRVPAIELMRATARVQKVGCLHGRPLDAVVGSRGWDALLRCTHNRLLFAKMAKTFQGNRFIGLSFDAATYGGEQTMAGWLCDLRGGTSGYLLPKVPPHLPATSQKEFIRRQSRRFTWSAKKTLNLFAFNRHYL